jgi:glucosamine kinase
MTPVLIADSGSSKTEWCLVIDKKKKTIVTQGMSPYFLSGEQIKKIIIEDVFPKIKNTLPEKIFFYGTGCSNPGNVTIVKNQCIKKQQYM